MAPNDGQECRGSNHRSGWGTVPQARVMQINDDLSVRAICLVDEHASSHDMQMADALVAATALHLDMPVETANDRHYWHGVGLRVGRDSSCGYDRLSGGVRRSWISG